MLDALKPSREFRPLTILLGALGAFLGFPNPLFQVPGLALALPVALCALASAASTPGLAFKRGWFLGFLAYGSALYWLPYPIHYYGSLSWFIALPCPVLLGLYSGLYPGLFALILRLGRDRLGPVAQAVLAATTWAALEQARGVIGSGFPWLPLATTLVPAPVAIQAASILGAYGLSGLLAGMVRLACDPSRMARISAAGLAVAVLGFGLVRLNVGPAIDARVDILAVQGNLDQSVKWSPEVREYTLERYLRLTDNGLAKGRADLVLWPETAMPFYFQEDNDLTARVREFARERRINLVTGAPGYELDPAQATGYRYYNRAFHVATDGELAGYTDKRHLVPFGEYFPFSKYLPFAGKLVEGAGDFFPGDPQRKLTFGPLRIGMMVCYEVIFPELAQDDVRAGANLIVSLSNDAWFGPTAAPEQHLQISIFRAVEQNRYLIRSTNTGYSVLVDPRGRLLEKSPLFHTASMRFAQVGLISERTIYSHLYTPLLLLIWGLALGLTGYCVIAGRRSAHSSVK